MDNTKEIKQNPELGLVFLPGFADGERDKSVHRHIQEINAKITGTTERFEVGIRDRRFGSSEGTVGLAPNEPTSRKKHLVFIQDVLNRSEECGYKIGDHFNLRSANDHFADLKSSINASAKKAKLGECTAVMPYLYACRQDKSGHREGLDMAVALNELVNIGIRNVIVVDAHNPTAAENAIYKNSFDNILPSYDLVTEVLKSELAAYMDGKIMTFSPDQGASARTRSFASILMTPKGSFEKERNFTKFENGKHPIGDLTYVGDRGSVVGKTAFIFDDMLDSGGTILEVAKMLKELGAKSVSAVVTHGIFNKGLEPFDRAVESKILKNVFTTNSVYLGKEARGRDWLKIVDITELIAHSINALHRGESLTPHVRGSEKLQTLCQSLGLQQDRFASVRRLAADALGQTD